LWIDLSPDEIDSAMPVVALDLAHGLATRGVGVRLYSQGERLRWKTSAEGLFSHQRVPRPFDPVTNRLLRAKHALDAFRDDGSEIPTESVLRSFSYGVLSALDMRRQHIAIAHINIFDHLIPVVRKLSPRTRIVFHMHDHKQTRRDKKVVGKRLSQAHAIVGCSEFITNRVRIRFPEVADRCHTVHNAVDTSLYTPVDSSGVAKGRRRRLVFVGRISPEKGVHTLLEAFQLVVERERDVELELYGPDIIPALREVDVTKETHSLEEIRPFYADPPGYRRHLDALIKPSLQGRVHFRGPLLHRHAPDVFRDADIVVFPPIWHEPFGLPAIEAMASGKPVVTTSVGGIPEIVRDRETALVVEPGNTRGLAAALMELLTSAERRATLGAAGREHVKRHFAWNTRIDDWLLLYENVLTQSAKPRKRAMAAASLSLT